MLLLLGAFIAGILTVLAPCVLPLLPIIIGGSVTGDSKDKKRPIVIAVALAISLIIFTLLLKATTVLINVPPQYITYISGAIIITLGVFTLFPGFYATIIGKLGIEQRAQKALGKGFNSKGSLVGPIITGAALGPVFSSCSPVYGYILATVLPVNFAQGMIYIISYVLGLSIVLLAIGYYGQSFIGKIKFAANPRGWFQRALAILFIVVGLLVATGYDKRVQTYVSTHTPFNFDALSAKLIPAGKTAKIDKTKLFNVAPYKAPELTGLQNWINSQPQTLASLKGKVVLVDFWTYSCINCIRNNPYIESYYKTYKDAGFTVLGIHAPEFAFERIPANVQKAVKQQGLTYPVALDNGFNTWNAFQNQYWPAEYLIDAKGQVRRVHYGEGEYSQMDSAIQQLLMENGASISGKSAIRGVADVPSSPKETAETYLGTQRASNYAGSPALGAATSSSVFTAPATLSQNNWALTGKWDISGDKITARGNSTLTFRIAAKEAYVVGGSATPQKIGVMLDGKPISQTGNAGDSVVDSAVSISDSTLYRLVKYPKFTADSTITLTVPDGVELNVFTFGS
ncbi:MAG: hypothetical protein JWM81_520 [Candidatus Saccharibacteria bacterium]|nr:hypothetical protein [Candidatus Saccharibacteria bacterium]